MTNYLQKLPVTAPAKHASTFIAACTFIFLCLLAVVQPTTVWAGQHIAVSKDTKPADPNFSLTRVTFDCDNLIELDLSGVLSMYAVFDTTISGDTTEGQNLLSGYSCQQWNESGFEHIYRLTIDETMYFWAGLQNLDEIDFDIFLLNACDTEACLTGGNSEIGLTLEPGEYVLIIDECRQNSTDVDGGPYTLNIECRPLGIPAQACENAVPKNCVVATTPPDTLSLFGQDNLVQIYECSPILEHGGEIWFAVTVPAYHECTATVRPLVIGLDPALWMFAGCGPEAVCVDFTDSDIAGKVESLQWNNNFHQPMTIYLAVDSAREVLEEDLGKCEISFSCLPMDPTPEKKQSFGNLKSLYR